MFLVKILSSAKGNFEVEYEYIDAPHFYVKVVGKIK